MKKRIYIVIGIVLLLAVVAFNYAKIISYFTVTRIKSAHSFMSEWSNAKVKAYKDWYVQFHLDTSIDSEDWRLKHVMLKGKANNIVIDSYWRNEWEKYWQSIRDKESLNYNGY